MKGSATVGWNLVQLHEGQRGVKAHQIGLCTALVALKSKLEWWRKSRLIIYCNPRSIELLAEMVPSIASDRSIELRTFRTDPRRRAISVLSMQSALARGSRLDGLDVLHSFDYQMPFFISSRTRTLATVHDLAYLRIPRTFSSVQRLTRRVLVPQAITHADRIVTVSSAVAADLKATFPRRADKIRVVPNGPGTAVKVAPKASVQRSSYLLSVGTLNRHKNYDVLIRAAAVAGKPLHLIIVGSDRGLKKPLLDLADGLGMRERVRILSRVDRSELADLYAGAEAVVVPSAYEGFGIPALEALQFHKRLVCSDIPALREVAGEAAIYAKPGDAADLARAISEAVEMPSADHEWRAARQVAKFSWEKSAAEVLKIYHELLSSTHEVGGKNG